METTGNIRGLFEKYISGTATPAEIEQLTEITEEYSNDELADILEPLAMSYEKDPNFKMEEWEPAIRSILQHAPERKAKIIFTNWYRVAAAAVIVLMLSVSGYFYFNKKSEPVIAKSHPSSSSGQNDIPAPASSKAMITLADGTTVTLDSVTSGTLAKQGNVNVIKTADGKIIYNGSATEVAYNTLTNPRGSQVVDITLADGSRVWLNAGSSIKYPVAFIGKDRPLEMKGEAYFEVAHDAKKTFTVSVKGMNVQVLGTHFNINAYDDENVIRTTLLDGSVRVSTVNRQQSTVIKPGQQARVLSGGTSTGSVSVVNNIDVDEVMAWKNGLFHLNAADIETIMRQVARWYNVDVRYEGKVKQVFYGTIPRSASAANVFKVLEETGGVHFKIEGKKVIVMP
jgi:transmembrane sensor